MSTHESIVAVWLDGASCPVEVREAWALDALDADRLARAAREDGLGACLVSTCFRVELFVSGDRPAEALKAWAREHLAAARPDAPRDGFLDAEGEDALRHLFRVAAGLESAVLGEAQILGQVRRARAAAEAAGVLRPALRAAFDTAVRTGQWARRVTDLGRGTASTASAAVQWAEDAVGTWSRPSVLVIGGGQMGRLLLGRLADTGAAVTLVSAHAPAHQGFTVVHPDALADALPGASVVFAATDRLAPAVGRLPGITLADIDALGAVVDAGLAAREAAVPDVEAAIETALVGLRDALAGLRREALVADFRRRAEAIRQDTLASTEADDLDQLSRTLTNRLLHDVTAALRSAQADDDALRALLSLDDG